MENKRQPSASRLAAYIKGSPSGRTGDESLERAERRKSVFSIGEWNFFAENEIGCSALTMWVRAQPALLRFAGRLKSIHHASIIKADTPMAHEEDAGWKK